MKPSEVIEAVQKFGEPELETLLDGLCPCMAAFPLGALLRLADEITKTIEAKGELAAMRAAVSAADQAADDAEAAATGTPIGKLP